MTQTPTTSTEQNWRGVAADNLGDDITQETSAQLATRSRRLLGDLLRPYSTAIKWLIVIVVIENAARLSIPYLVKVGIDSGIPPIQEDNNLEPLLVIVSAVLVATITQAVARNLFLKGGINFGEDGVQRLQLSYSNFKIEGNGDYIQVEGCRPGTCPNPVTNTSERGQIFGSKAEFNDFEQLNALYTHGDFFGGNLVLNAYWADQAMRYLPENGDDRQLVWPLPSDAERIFDQSEITSKKWGFRPSWTRTRFATTT